MKKIFLLILIIVALKTTAQPGNSILKNSINVKPDVEKVIKDFYNYFDNIRGEKITETESTVEFQSNIKPAGSSESSITQIKGLANVYSWQAVMLSTDDFDKAAAKYKQLYKQLNKTSFLLYNKKPLKFMGDYDEPDESRSFASSILKPDTDDIRLKKLKIEIGMNYTMPEWNVRILVYEKESDADVRPTETKDQ